MCLKPHARKTAQGLTQGRLSARALAVDKNYICVCVERAGPGSYHGDRQCDLHFDILLCGFLQHRVLQVL